MKTLQEVQDACSRCHGAGYLSLDVPPADLRFGQIVPCVCTKEWNHERRIEELRLASGLPPRLQLETFDGWKPRGNSNDDAKSFMESYANNPGDQSILLLGERGTGKTKLAAAVVNRQIELEQEAVFHVVPNLLDYLRSTFHPDSQVRTDVVFDAVKGAKLLVLDELRTEGASRWALEKLYQILNDRYNAMLPTVITTNVAVNEIDPIVRSRVSFSGVRPVKMIRSQGGKQ